MPDDDVSADKLLGEIYQEVRAWRDASVGSLDESNAGSRLIGRFEVLDEHLSAGGDLPTAWDVSSD